MAKSLDETTRRLLKTENVAETEVASDEDSSAQESPEESKLVVDWKALLVTIAKKVDLQS